MFVVQDCLEDALQAQMDQLALPLPLVIQGLEGALVLSKCTGRRALEDSECPQQ